MDPLVIALAIPRIFSAGRYRLADRGFPTAYRQERSHALHLHDYRGTWRCGGGNHALEPGTVTLSPQGMANWYDLPREGRHWCIHFEVLPAAGGGLAVPLITSAGADAAYARERLARIAALHDHARGGDRPTAIAAGAALLELLVWLARLAGAARHGDRGGAAGERAAALVRGRLEHPWTTGELAHRTGITPAWLAHAFRTRFGMTVARYVLVQRVERARVLLATSTLPVAEIGRLVGFADPQHFNKRFRAISGLAPSACRGRIDRPG